MDKTKLSELIKSKDSFVIDFKQLCLLKKEHDLNLLQGIGQLSEDPTALAKVISVALQGAAPGLTPEQVEEHLSLSDLPAALEGIGDAYVKHFEGPKKKSKPSVKK